MSDTEEIQEFTLGEADDDFTYNLDDETKADNVPTVAEHPSLPPAKRRRPPENTKAKTRRRTRI